MSIKEQLSKLPEDVLKKQLLKMILKDVDVSDEVYQESFKRRLRSIWIYVAPKVIKSMNKINTLLNAEKLSMMQMFPLCLETWTMSDS